MKAREAEAYLQKYQSFKVNCQARMEREGRAFVIIATASYGRNIGAEHKEYFHPEGLNAEDLYFFVSTVIARAVQSFALSLNKRGLGMPIDSIRQDLLIIEEEDDAGGLSL